MSNFQCILCIFVYNNNKKRKSQRCNVLCRACWCCTVTKGSKAALWGNLYILAGGISKVLCRGLRHMSCGDTFFLNEIQCHCYHFHTGFLKYSRLNLLEEGCSYFWLWSFPLHINVSLPFIATLYSYTSLSLVAAMT